MKEEKPEKEVIGNSDITNGVTKTDELTSESLKVWTAGEIINEYWIDLPDNKEERKQINKQKLP